MAAAEVARLVARLEADVRDFDRDIKKATKRLDGLEKQTKQSNAAMKKTGGAMGGLTKGVKAFGAAVAASFAVKAVVDFAQASVSAAVDLNESINAVNVTFGEAAEGVKELGRTAAENLGLANSEFNSLSVQFSAFVDKIAGSSGQSVVQVLKDLTQRAADFASVMNIDVAEAARLFQSGLAGETEAVRKFGVDLSAAAVNAKALALGLAESSSALTEQDKILARYELLMEQTEKTSGDFANTSDDLANAMRRLSAKFEDAKAKVGEALIPTLESLIPLGEDIIGVLADMGLGLGLLTGSIDGVEVAVRRANLGLKKGEDGFDGLLKSVDNLRKGFVPLKPSDIIDFGRFGENLGLPGVDLTFVDSITAETVALLEGFDDLGGAFGITQDNLNRLNTDGFRRAALEMGFTKDALQLLIDLIQRDVQANVTKDILKKTQETRDAVLDGTDAILNLPPPNPEVAIRFSLLGTAAEQAARAIELAHNKLRAFTDPVFAATDAARAFAEGEEVLAAALAKHGEDSDEAVEAGLAQLGNYVDLIGAAKELAKVTGKGLATALRELGKKAEIPDAIIESIIASLDEFDGKAAEAELIVDMAEEDQAELDRWMAINDTPSNESTTELKYVERNPAALERFLLANDTTVTTVLNYEEKNRAALNRFLAVNTGPGGPSSDSSQVIDRSGDATFKGFATGGVVPGPIGKPMVAVVHGGEEVRTPAQQQAGGGVQIGPFHIGEMTEDLLDETIEDLLGASLTLNAETR